MLIDAGRDLGVGNGDASAASSSTAAAGRAAAGGGVCDANDNLLFHDHIGVCVDRSTDQGHRAILITKAECISADNGVRIILFQRPSYRSRIGRQLFRSKGLAELIERRYLSCRQIQRSVFPNGRRNSVCGNRSQTSRGIDRQRNVVTLDVAGTGIDLGRIFFQCLECSVFERNHIRLGGNPFKAATGHFSAILIVADSGKLICKNRIFIQPQDKTVLHVGADCLEGRLLLDLNNDILCSLAGRGRGGFQNHIRIGGIRDTANRNEQFSVFNRGIGLIGVCQRPLDVRRNSTGIAVLIARQQRNAGQIILCPEVIFSVGGDGTLLRAIHTYIDRLDEIQFVAIHTGNLGFFTDYTQDEVDHLVYDLKHNQPKIEEFNLLQMDLPQVNETLYALNEVRIESLAKTLVLDISIDDEFFESSQGSGICVSTQSGSTAVNRALKGAVVDPGLKVLQLCEIMPISHKNHHSLKNPYIMNDTRKIGVRGDTLAYAHVCFDHLERDLESISEIIIHSSTKKVRFARYRTYSYLTRLKNLY